jgi:hypothetical protein
MKIKAVITGVTGMVGKGVLKELGLAMINMVTKGCEKPALEAKCITEMVKRYFKLNMIP